MVVWYSDCNNCFLLFWLPIIFSGEQLFNCIWLQARGPNVMEFQVQESSYHFFRVPGTRITFFVCLQSSRYPTTTKVICFQITLLSFSWDSGPRRPRPFNSVITTTFCRGPGTHKYLRLFSCFDCCFRCCYYCVFQARQNPLSQESCPIAGTYLGHLPDAPGLCARLVSNCKNRWELSSSLLSLLLLLLSSSLSSICWFGW